MKATTYIEFGQTVMQMDRASKLHGSIGSPPDWENAPDEFQAAFAALDRLEDEALWKVAIGHKTEEEMARHFESLERNKEHTLTSAEQVELAELRFSKGDATRSQVIFSCDGKPMLLLFCVGVVIVFLIPDRLCLPIFLNL